MPTWRELRMRMKTVIVTNDEIKILWRANTRENMFLEPFRDIRDIYFYKYSFRLIQIL